MIDVEQYEQILAAIDQKIAYEITNSRMAQGRHIDSKVLKDAVGRVLNLDGKSEAG